MFQSHGRAFFSNDARVARIDSFKVGQYIQNRGSCKPAADSVLSKSRLARQLCLQHALSSNVH